MPRIHVVDDDPTVLRLIGEALHKRGYAVETFNRPELYLETVRERPDLLISDLLMPGLDGVSFCAALRSSPAMRTVPIIVVTGLVVRDGMQSDHALRERFGVQAIINKPFALRYLFESVERVVGPADGAPREEQVAVQIDAAEAKKVQQLPLAAIPLKQMSTQPMSGTRFEPRYEVSFSVAFESGAQLTREFTENVSRGGVFVRTHAPPPVGADVALTLHVPWENEPISLSSTVTHVSPPGSGQTPGFGCCFANDDRAALERWFSVVNRVAEQHNAPHTGPRVLLLGFSGERVADLMRQAGVLCRSELRIVPLASWEGVLREAEKNEQQAKLLIIDVSQSNDAQRTALFNWSMLRRFADIPNVSLAYVGLKPEDDSELPTDQNVIRAGALTSTDLVGALVGWLKLPERTHMRVAATGTIAVTQDERHVAGELLDVSMGGARFLSDQPLRHSERAVLTFRLGVHGAVDELASVVRWCKPEGRGRWMCGVAFDSREAVKTALVERYILEQTTYLQSLERFKQR